MACMCINTENEQETAALFRQQSGNVRRSKRTRRPFSGSLMSPDSDLSSCASSVETGPQG